MDTNSVMLVFVLVCPIAPTVVVGVRIAVCLLANITPCRIGAVEIALANDVTSVIAIGSGVVPASRYCSITGI